MWRDFTAEKSRKKEENEIKGYFFFFQMEEITHE
jgi:hypothetical protein